MSNQAEKKLIKDGSKSWPSFGRVDQSHGHLLGGMPHMLPGDHRERDALQKDWNTR